MERQRLDRVLAHMGFGTRSQVRKRIKQGQVQVNGTVVKDHGLQVQPSRDQILVQGKRVQYQRYMYVMMNKPQDVISATEDRYERTVIDLLDDRLRHFHLFPVGRLDKDTIGLLLLTNDGRLAHELLSPRKRVEKTYIVEVDGPVDHKAIQAFRAGVELDDGYITLPAELEIIHSTEESAKVNLTIREGKFHQVKRMFRAIGRRVLALQRVRMGSLVLDEQLAPGEYRELTTEELELLLKTHSRDG